MESKQGVIKIDAEMQKLEPATKFGPEYLTYVMWAITPEGRATNVGEVLLNGGKSKLDATTELQSFGLIITAEPYFAVTQPSDVVVMENFVRHDTDRHDRRSRCEVRAAAARPVHAERESRRDQAASGWIARCRWNSTKHETPFKSPDGPELSVTPPIPSRRPWIGLENAEGYLKGKAGSKPIGTVAREAVQMAEDARIITVKKIEEEELANERQAGVEREARAESARAAAQSETERIAREAERTRVAAQTEAQRVAREHEAQAVAAQTEADRLKRENDAQRATAQTDLDRVAGERAQAEADKAQLRAQLLAQFNAILQTRDTARGLVVNMSDVLFDTAKYSLRPLAREKLARVAGILSGHPGLRMQVEGYTDSVGSDDYNQTLSEHRATSVRDYLTQAGIPTASVTAKGFGKTQPVASNDTSTGRQQNRRVELVVSGEIIGAEIRPSPVLAAK